MINRALTLGLLLASVSFSTLAFADDDKTNPKSTPREQATAFYRQGNFPEAISIFRELAQARPDNVDAQKDLMWTLWNAGQFEDAGDVADRVLHQAPKDVEAKTISDRAFLTAHRERILFLRTRAAALVRAGNYAKAADIFKELTTLDAYNYRLLKDAMWANLGANRSADALALARRIVGLRPDDGDAIDVLIHAAGTNEDPALYAHLPFAAQIKVASVLADGGHLQEALAMLHRLAAQKPNSIDVLRYLASICHRAGLFTEGLSAARQWTVLRPNDARSWYWLATLQMDLGQINDAQDSFRRSVEINPNQPLVELAIGRYYLGERDFDNAMRHLDKAHRDDPSLEGVYPLLAKGYYWTQHYDQSADFWKQSIALYPTRTEYRFNKAQALYYAGHRPEALDEMRVISNDQPAAFLFLVDDALAHQDTATAVSLLKNRLKDVHPADEALVLKLCDLYNSQQKWDAISALTNRYLAVNPDSEGAWLMKGNALYAKKDYSGCAAVNQHILDINPNDVDALQTLAACERAMGHHASERAALRRLRQVDPTNPYYLLLDVQSRYDDGFVVDSKKTVEDWQRVNSASTVLTILLYHALTPFKDDPILAYPYHTTTKTFEDQLQALISAGYTPVSTEQVGQWSRHLGTLPDHALLITFDDGRLDSFLYGDPILQKMGLKATMFAALVNAEGTHPAGFLPWSGLIKVARTGRWAIESHGDEAHLHVAIDDLGTEGLFLVNRAWKPTEKRLETLDEWRLRISADYQSSDDKILNNIGQAPDAFAYPEGIYGQEGVVNTPQALDTTIELTSKTFSTAYSQDHYGINLQSRDPYRLKRLEPSNTWDGAHLLQQLRDNDPRVWMISQQLDWAAAEGRQSDAETYLKQLKAYQVSDGLRLSKEAEIALASGDLSRGRLLTQQALAFGDFPDLRRTLADAEKEEGWSYDAAVTFDEDSSERRSLLFEQELRTKRLGPWRFGLRQQWGWYRDTLAGTIFDDGAGLEAQYYLGLYHTFTAIAMGQGLSSPASNTFTALGEWEARWREHITTVLEGGQRFVPTASAMAAGIDDRFIEGRGTWDINEWWRAATDDRFSALTDTNRIVSTEDEISRLVWSPINLRLVYELTYQNASELRPQYYSPQNLIINAFGPEFWMRLGDHTKWWFRYTPGYAVEDNNSSQFVHILDTHLEIDWFPDSLEPDFWYYQTPNYHERLYRLEYVHRF